MMSFKSQKDGGKVQLHCGMRPDREPALCIQHMYFAIMKVPSVLVTKIQLRTAPEGQKGPLY